MSNVSNNASGGIGFFGLLTIAFIILKLMGYINWSWFWVLFPLFGPLIIILTVLSIIALVSIIVTFFDR